MPESIKYSKALRDLYQYCRDKPALGNIGAIVNFFNDNTTDSFKFKQNYLRKEMIVKQVLK